MSRDDASHAVLIIEEIARSLDPAARPPVGLSLSTGDVGHVLFFAHVAEQFPDRGFDEWAERYLEALLERLEDTEIPVDHGPSLYGSFLGAAWLLRHLHHRFGLELDESATESADEVILHYLSLAPFAGRYDLINGLVGIGIYALEGEPTRAQRAILELVLGHLERHAIHDPRGASWRQDTPDWEPEGRSNLGMAHGLPGVLAFLGMAILRGVGSHLRPLLESGVAYLLAQQRLDGRFPAREGDEQAARLGWCYGDASNASALLIAARALESNALGDRAVAIARAAAACSLPDSRVRDAGLCHGAAGLMHIFNCLQQATGDPELLDAARLWRRRTLEMHQPNTGIGGYRSYMNREWHDDRGYLTGSLGVGLALLATVSSSPPDWDAPLLLSALRPSSWTMLSP